MEKVLIIGNSGSGKTWLSSRLARRLGVSEISLDSIVWESGGYNQKRPQKMIEQDVHSLKMQPKWVVEGVFGALAEMLMDSADTLIFLDMDWRLCKSSLLSRSSESSKQLDSKLAEENFQELLAWASEYSTRESKSSWGFHNQLFESFSGKKMRFTQRQQVNDFLEH